MHYTPLVFYVLLSFLSVAHAYPVPRWRRTPSNDALLSHQEHAQLLRTRQVAPPTVIPPPISTLKSTPSPTPAISSTPVASSTPASGGPKKYVVAHHMVGNTYPYTLQDWADDIALAHSSGLDGFALNMGREEWELARVSDA